MRAPKLIWPCDVCKKPIADGTGYLHISAAGLSAYKRDLAVWYEEHPGTFHNLGELMDMPDEVRWEAHHHDCDPDSDTADYWFRVSEVRTHAGLLRWTAHLMGKSWIGDTNWDHVIRGQADSGGLEVAS